MNHHLWKVAALVLLLSACKSTPMNPAVNEGSSVTRPMPAAQDERSADTPAAPNKITIKTVDVDSSKDELSAAELAKRQIFFDYDSDAIRDEYRGLITHHAKYLVAHPQTKVVVQGNTDERGSHEYNLALGQRRAVAVKKALNLEGVNDQQIETVSYGEERAKQNCAEEDCFQHDRRVDVVYSAQ
ncbi:peptidoglycan-associated lipoprotein Pal [Methylophilus luteus]|jgi:peptidoglycan-associated lipoprotein|uniref:Peptidoglycan-associated lipoprotein n=1 Tax=Methylophilus luteus TaxID=640108 RepID=A0ABW3F679_9PROT